MFDSVVLDVVIGLVFIYLLYSLMVTLIGEIISSNINIRGLVLRQSIKRMLSDSRAFKGSFAEKFYNTPSIKYLAANDIIKWPSYISADMFSTTVIGLLRKKKTASTIMEEIRIGVNCHDFTTAPETRKQLLHLIEEANGNVDEFKKGLEGWFNETQDRATGWFKRRMQLILFVIGFVLAAVFNINSIKIADILTNNNEARYKVLAMASDSTTRANMERIIKHEQKRKQDQLAKEEAGKQHVAYDSSEKNTALHSSSDTVFVDTMAYHQYKEIAAYSEQVTDILGLGLEHAPVYKLKFCKWEVSIYKHIIPLNKDFAGILITALALSLGAPFWFGLLNKLLVLRGSGKNTDEEKAKQTEEGKPLFKAISANLQKDQNNHHLSEHVAKDPLLYAIAMNEQLWKKIPGVLAVSKDYILTEGKIKTPCIEISHSKNFNRALLPQKEVDVYFQGEKYTFPIEKRELGDTLLHFADTGTAQSGIRIFNAINKPATADDPDYVWGSLTGIIKDAKNGRKLLLGCAHVLQANNTEGKLNGSTKIVNGDGKEIAALKYYMHTSIYDVAWAELNNQDDYKAYYIKAPRVITSEDADDSIKVTIYGAKTTNVVGEIWNVNSPATFTYPNGKLKMFNLLKITNVIDGQFTAISDGGDSGAILRDEAGTPVGMVVGGNSSFTYAIKLSDIFNSYDEIAPIV